MTKVVLPVFAGIYLLLLFMLLTPHLSEATEEYSRQSGQDCAVCHLEPGGGGELTASGKSFFASQHSKTDRPATGMSAKLFRLVVGYIHFFTAIFWFGTILYVHLILKPVYAAGGLPRGELRVGIISMVVMGISGVILTFYRIPYFGALFDTRFGILLVTKISLYLIMVLSAVVVITVIGPRLKAKRKEPVATDATGVMTLEALASAGGMLRDLLSAKVPMVLPKDVYASACLAGGAMLYLLQLTAMPSAMTALLSASTVIILRLLAVRYNWSLPQAKDSPIP
jgi:uncharacterized membrane protein YeiH